MENKTNFKVLEARIEVSFKNDALLGRALTHASARPPSSNNERLEFLGDRVLGLSIAELLHEKFADHDEGSLAKRFNNLVKRDACAEVARKLDLGRFIILGSGEDSRDGREKTSILADACEALLGAIFLDQGFDIARNFVVREWTPLLDNAAGGLRDPKSALQEWAQGQGAGLPQYEILSRAGPDHAPEFVVEVIIDGIAPASGTGASKRRAEQAAAAAVIKREKISNGG